MKRIICVLMLVVVCITCFSGCDKKPPNSGADGSQTAEGLNYNFPSNIGADPNNHKYYGAMICGENEIFVSYSAKGDLINKYDPSYGRETLYFLCKLDHSGKLLAKTKVEDQVTLMNLHDGVLYGSYENGIAKIDPDTLTPQKIIEYEMPSEKQRCYVDAMLIVDDYLFYTVFSAFSGTSEGGNTKVYAYNLKTAESILFGSIRYDSAFIDNPVLTSDGEYLYILNFSDYPGIYTYKVDDINSNTKLDDEISGDRSVSGENLCVLATNGIVAYTSSHRDGDSRYVETVIDPVDAKPEIKQISIDKGSYRGDVFDINGTFYSVEVSSSQRYDYDDITIYSYVDKDPSTATVVDEFTNVMSYCKYNDHLYGAIMENDTIKLVQLV